MTNANIGLNYRRQLQERTRQIRKKVLKIEAQTLTEEKKEFEAFYQQEIQRVFNIKKTSFVRLTKSKVYFNDKNKSPLFNLWFRRPLLISAHFENLTSSGTQIILFENVKKAINKRNFKQFLNNCFRQNMAFIKQSIIFIKYNQETSKILKRIVKASYLQQGLNRQQATRETKNFLSLQRQRREENVIIPVATIVDFTRRRRRFKIEDVKNNIKRHYLLKLNQKLNQENL